MAESRVPAITPRAKTETSKVSRVKKSRTTTARDVFAPETATDQEKAKRGRAVSVYLTEDDHLWFRRWAFERQISMSDVLAQEVKRLRAEESGS